MSDRHEKRIVWIDQDAGSFRAIWRELSRDGVEIIPASSVAEGAYIIQHTEHVEGIILDALVQMSRRGSEALGPTGTADLYRNVAGHHVFDVLDHAEQWRQKTVVLSIVGKGYLREAGFPDDFAAFFQKDEVIERTGFVKFMKKLRSVLLSPHEREVTPTHVENPTGVDGGDVD